MWIYQVKVEYCSESNSDMFNYIVEDKYFIFQENAEKYVEEQRTKYKSFNDSNYFEKSGVGEYYRVSMQQLLTAD